MFKKASWLYILLPLLLSQAAVAMSLDVAKANGYVGEQYDGYIGVVHHNVPEDVHALVSNVNAKRRAHYQSISQKTQTSLANVEALAGQKAIERTPAGQYIKLKGGGWIKK